MAKIHNPDRFMTINVGKENLVVDMHQFKMEAYWRDECNHGQHPKARQMMEDWKYRNPAPPEFIEDENHKA